MERKYQQTQESPEQIRILLADDHSDFRKVVFDFLKRMPGVHVVGEAVDGFEVVSKTEELGPDLVLMDITMPRRNGLDATKIIKDQWPSVKVLITTMHDDPFYRSKAESVNADGFLPKNDLRSSLEHSIREIFGSRMIMRVPTTGATATQKLM